MYQLAHMITEQRNLLHELMDASVLGDKVRKAIPKSINIRFPLKDKISPIM